MNPGCSIDDLMTAKIVNFNEGLQSLYESGNVFRGQELRVKRQLNFLLVMDAFRFLDGIDNHFLFGRNRLFHHGDIYRITEKIEYFFPECFSILYVPEHIDVFMEVDVKRISFITNVRGDSINDLFFFWLIRSEYPVPNNKGRTEIFVDVLFL